MYISTQKKGYSLIEVLVAISILLLSIVGPMTIAVKGLQASLHASEKATAIFLAQEGIEAFISARNDAAIAAVRSGDLTVSWDWVGNIDASCFTAVGCNLDFRNANPLGTIQSCSNIESCRLFYDATDIRARYSLNSTGAIASPYIRTIVLSYDNTPNNRGIQIKSTVSWNSTLFNNQTQDVTLIGTMFSLYE